MVSRWISSPVPSGAARIQNSGSQSVICKPAASASPENTLEKQNLSTLDLVNQPSGNADKQPVF